MNAMPNRSDRIMNTIINTSIILMSTIFGGLTGTMMDVMADVSSGIAGAFGGEEPAEEVRNDIGAKKPEAEAQMKTLISDARKDIYAQYEEKRAEIEPMLADPVFDKGPTIVEGYDFGLPKMSEELDDSTLAAYSELLIHEDPEFSKMFKELTEWMNTLPKMPDK